MIEAPMPVTFPRPLSDVERGLTDTQPFAESDRRLTLGQRLWLAADWSFGFVAIVVGVAILSVIPLLNFFSLGYLIEASGRVAKSGKIRAGFVGVRKASVIGSITIGSAVALMPALYASSMWKDGRLIAPAGDATKTWYVLAIIFTTLACVHITWSIIRGGRIRHFLWPAPIKFFRWMRSKEKYLTVRDGCLDYLVSLRLPYYFWLGFRAFVGAVIWLAIPVAVLVLAANIPNDVGSLLVSLLGAGLLMIAVMYLPFIQSNFAVTNRFETLFNVREVRGLFRRAPLAFWLALFITLLFALPLYVAKVELAPRELAWLPSLVFVIFIFPARLLTGWALSRGMRRETPSHGVFRWLSRLAGIPVLMAYAFFVYLMQYLSWHGSWGMLEQHAFLVPAPMLSM